MTVSIDTRFEMGKPKHQSPAVKKANAVKKKYNRSSPGKSLRCKRAILAIEKKEAKINEPVQGPSEASDPALSKTIVLENSVVKGYHAYQIKPPITDPPTKLRVDREYTNIVDRDACLVWLPELEEFDKKNCMT